MCRQWCDIVVPLRIESIVGAGRPEKASVVGSIFQHEKEVALAPRSGVGGARDFRQDVRLAVIDDGVDRIEPQAVEVIFLEPVQRVV